MRKARSIEIVRERERERELYSKEIVFIKCVKKYGIYKKIGFREIGVKFKLLRESPSFL